ncbi:MAG: hypothetical protein AB7I59_04995 [Geminicoccaceae bacterium]
MTIATHSKRLVVSAGLTLVAATQAGSARAEVRHTYHGAECEAVLPAGAGSLNRFRGVRALAQVEVVCPIVKAIFNSEEAVIVGVAASGGTFCRVESYDVLAQRVRFTPPQVFPGVGLSTLQFRLTSSLRGAMHLRCTLQQNDEILNYIAAEVEP